jgi:hypothetical protein
LTTFEGDLGLVGVDVAQQQIQVDECLEVKRIIL